MSKIICKDKIFVIETENTHYVIGIDKEGCNRHVYWGKKCDVNDYEIDYNHGENAHNTVLDEITQEYTVFGSTMYRESALKANFADGCREIDLKYTGYEQNGNTLSLNFSDTYYPLAVTLNYEAVDGLDIITRWTTLKNTGSENISFEKLFSAEFTLPSKNAYRFKNTNGSWGGEFLETDEELKGGSLAFQSRGGVSGHNNSPSFIAYQNADEKTGDVYFASLAYSGNFKVSASRDLYNTTRVLLGINDFDFEYLLKAGESFDTPKVFCGYTRGFGEMSRQMNKFAIDYIFPKPYNKTPLPVLYNSWEATYFDVNSENQCALAEKAAEIGVELFVMDDGWFGKREDDNSGLGDWQVNEKKLGCTLKELTKKVNEKGVAFGIWIEPEMVSEDSELYRNHPDWVLRISGREPVRGRNQLVLDFSRAEVREFIFGQICGILDQGKIMYVKWDMNRSIVDVYSMENDQGKVSYDYVLGVYDFLEKLLQRYPDILIEGCCGGGGRFDAGMLYYTPQIWCSDNTDALDRLRIQYGTSFFYPASAVASHVSAIPNHQTGRSVNLHTRGVVAMAGAFGYELDPEKLTEEEKAAVREQVRQYKEWEMLIRKGRYYRLSDPFKAAYTAWMSVSENKDRALVSVVMLKMHGNMPVSYVKMRGLEPGAMYRDAGNGECYYGADLMEAGLPMPVEQKEYPAYQIELVRLP